MKKMTIEQAIYEIVNASYQERIQAISVIADSLKQIAPEPLNKPKTVFQLKPFDLGNIETPTRDEIYTERNQQILGISNE